MTDFIYLDNNATTPCAPEVVAEMLPFFCSEFANPSSAHISGRQAAQHVEKARREVAAALDCEPTEVIFTSGATESNNMALLGVQRVAGSRNRILVAATEHKSVLAPCDMLRAAGFVVEHIPVDSKGMLRMDYLGDHIGTDVLLVSVQAANNEVGTIQPIREVSRLSHSVDALFHCDAAQALGKIEYRVHELGVDLASFSGHKLYGPKGVGALFIRQGLVANRVMPVFGGGAHEFGFRPGTLNVPGIVGMAIACELSRSRLTADSARIASLRDKMEGEILRTVSGARVNGNVHSRLPGTTNITIEGVPADVLAVNVPDLCFSAGSACTSGSVAPSHVLLAMGYSHADAECSIRISLGRYSTMEDVERAVTRIASGVSSVRSTMRSQDYPAK
ncbi:MAG: cysteine desulfurase family protein [Thermoguttaceae bacterium]